MSTSKISLNLPYLKARLRRFTLPLLLTSLGGISLVGFCIGNSRYSQQQATIVHLNNISLVSYKQNSPTSSLSQWLKTKQVESENNWSQSWGNYNRTITTEYLSVTGNSAPSLTVLEAAMIPVKETSSNYINQEQIIAQTPPNPSSYTWGVTPRTAGVRQTPTLKQPSQNPQPQTTTTEPGTTVEPTPVTQTTPFTGTVDYRPSVGTSPISQPTPLNVPTQPSITPGSTTVPYGYPYQGPQYP